MPVNYKDHMVDSIIKSIGNRANDLVYGVSIDGIIIDAIDGYLFDYDMRFSDSELEDMFERVKQNLGIIVFNINSPKEVT